MDEIVTFINTNLLPHWPFVCAMLIFMIIGQVVKTSVFPKDGWKTHKPVWLFWWGRKTLPLHPIVAGMLMGLVWHSPEAGVTTTAACVGYFAMAGAISVWAYEFLKGLAKKEGIDLNLPGVDDSVPPSPPSN
jgi:hypothetical protein